MARIAIATLQNGWDCRWSRLDDTGGPASPTGGSVVCDRTGVQRRVSLAECEGCVHWEFAPRPNETVALAAAPLHEPPSLPVPPSLPGPHSIAARALYLATWFAITGAAVILIVAGLSILTTPLAIPLTVTLFLSAAALVGFACTGQLPHP